MNICSVNNVTALAFFSGSVKHIQIDIPAVFDTSTGTIPPTSLLITDSYGNAVAGKTVILVLYNDANCTIVASQAVISGNNVTSNSSGYANFQHLKIGTAGSYFVGDTVGGVQSQCSLKPMYIADSAQSSPVSIGTIAGIVALIGLIIFGSIALALKMLNMWPFKRKRRRPSFLSYPRIPMVSSRQNLL